MKQDIPPPPPGFEIVGAGSLPLPPAGFEIQSAQAPAAPRRQQAAPAAPAMPAMAAPAARQPSGLSREDSINALLDQGYSPDEAVRLADEQIAFEGGQTSALAGQGVGDPFNPAGSAGPVGTQENPIDLTRPLMADEVPLLVQGAFVRGQNGEVYALPGDAFVSNPRPTDERQGEGTVYIRRPNASDSVEAFAQAAGEQLPFLDEAAAAVSGVLTGRGYSATREQQQLSRMLQNQTDRGARVAGGVAGFLGGLALPGGGYIAQGANRLQQVGRAAQVGAGYGALYGAGNTEGDLGERLQSGAQGAAIGAATGGIAQRLLARDPNAVPSAARELSREGVRLTPGQMAGGVINTLEEVGQSIPVLREATQGARRRGLEDFNRAVANRVLAPLGERVERGVEAGRTLVAQVRQRVQDRYTQALDGVQVAPDATFRGDYTARIANSNLAPDAQRELNSVLGNTIQARFNQAISGDDFKVLDEELGAAARAARNRGGPNDRYLAQVIEGIQDDMDSLLERVNPTAAAGKRQADEAYANLIRLEEAAAAPEAARRGGVFTPSQFSSSVRRSETGSRNARYARGDALMQDLSDRAMQVLPATVPDSGTPLRGLATGGLLSAGGIGLGIEPVTAAMAAGGVGLASLPHTQIGQNLLNALYRANDPAGKLAVLGQAMTAAAQNPALVPYYQQLLSSFQAGSVPYYQQLLSSFQAGSQNQGQPIAPAVQAQPLPSGP